MLLIFSGHNIILNCTIYTAPTFTSLDLSVREDGGSLSVCIMGGITNETVAIQTQNKSNADSKLNKNCYNYRLKYFFFPLANPQNFRRVWLGWSLTPYQSIWPWLHASFTSKKLTGVVDVIWQIPLKYEPHPSCKTSYIVYPSPSPPSPLQFKLAFLATTMMINMNGLLII